MCPLLDQTSFLDPSPDIDIHCISYSCERNGQVRSPGAPSIRHSHLRLGGRLSLVCSFLFFFFRCIFPPRGQNAARAISRRMRAERENSLQYLQRYRTVAVNRIVRFGCSRRVPQGERVARRV